MTVRAQLWWPVAPSLVGLGLVCLVAIFTPVGSASFVAGLLSGALLQLASVALGTRYARRVAVAARSMATLAEELASGSYGSQLALSGVAELDAAATALNSVGDQVQAQLTELSEQALRDPLTGLPNRLFLLDHLRQVAARVRRDDSSLAVLFIDLDDFKVINDSLGHRAGDQLLAEVARGLAACADDAAVVARLGGDEFAIVVNERDSELRAIQLADELHQRFESPRTVQGQSLFVRFSVGIAASMDGRERPDELLRNADMAMSTAKRAGKSRYALFNPEMKARAVHRLEMERDLRQGLARDEFQVYYQPLVDLPNGVFSEVEALVRWNHPTRGLVSPVEFIPVAEESGLIVPLGRWVLREACRQVGAWDRERSHAQPLTVGVNLSARQLLDPDLVDDVRAALADAGLPAERLKCEITESLALDDSAPTTRALSRLAELGVRFAIDDFGTGQSGLSYLRRFPVSTLKLDQSFVQGMQDNPDDAAFVRGVVALARALDLEITAEGIETASQLAAIKLLGCQIGQGYYFSRPLPALEVQRLLEEAAQARDLALAA